MTFWVMLQTGVRLQRAFWMLVDPPGVLVDVCWKPLLFVGLSTEIVLLLTAPFWELPDSPSGSGSASRLLAVGPGCTLDVAASAESGGMHPMDIAEADASTRKGTAKLLEPSLPP
ncbi:hypothetical protein [Nonomuraea antimicrobica]